MVGSKDTHKIKLFAFSCSLSFSLSRCLLFTNRSDRVDLVNAAPLRCEAALRVTAVLQVSQLHRSALGHTPNLDPPQYLNPDPCQGSRVTEAIGRKQGVGNWEWILERWAVGRKQHHTCAEASSPWNTPCPTKLHLQNTNTKLLQASRWWPQSI